LGQAYAVVYSLLVHCGPFVAATLFTFDVLFLETSTINAISHDDWVCIYSFKFISN
jgi:hypothetical protein